MLVIRIRTRWCGNGSGSLPAREQPAAQAPGMNVGQMGIPAAQVGGVAMRRGGDEAVLPMVELVREAPGLSVASRPLCPLTLQALQAPLLTASRPQLRQSYLHYSAPGPAWIASVPFRPAAE